MVGQISTLGSEKRRTKEDGLVLIGIPQTLCTFCSKEERKFFPPMEFRPSLGFEEKDFLKYF